MIRKTPKKPIRVFLQDGANDLDNNNGNWPLANQTLARSLAYARYDYRFEYGQRLPQPPPRPCDSAGHAAVVVAGLPEGRRRQSIVATRHVRSAAACQEL